MIGLLGVAALPVEAFAQEQTGRARNQSLQEQLKPRDVFTTQSVPTAETPKRPGSNDGAKKKPRPTIIEGQDGRQTIGVGCAGAVAHQAASDCKLAILENCRHPMLSAERPELVDTDGEELVTCDYESNWTQFG